MTTQGTPIVLLHGWGFTPAVWEPLIEALVAHGIARSRIQTPSLPLDAGLSFAQILAALLPTRAHVVGWSLGGELALALAQRSPSRVASLTLISSTPCFMNRDDWVAGQPASLLDDFDQRLAADPAALLKRFATLIRHGDAKASRDRSLAEYLAQAYETDPARLAAGLQLLRQVDLRTDSAAMSVPLMLVHGTRDAVTPLPAAQWLQQQTRATLHRIEGASHALPLTHPTRVAAYLSAFIEQLA